MPRILLFDIDGTLLSTAGAGARALEQAFEELVGLSEALAGVRLDGATDVAIVREALIKRGRPAPDSQIQALLARYTELLPSALTAAPGYRTLEGVPGLVARLEAERRPFGLCTGNVLAGARAKLSHGDLWAPFERGFLGGFGSDGEVRADIVRAALRRAEAHHGALHPSEALVIGDTPRDVEAAHAVGVPVLAVASGRHGLDELRATGAEHVLESLAAPAAVAILGLAA